MDFTWSVPLRISPTKSEIVGGNIVGGTRQKLTHLRLFGGGGVHGKVHWLTAYFKLYTINLIISTLAGTTKTLL